MLERLLPAVLPIALACALGISAGWWIEHQRAQARLATVQSQWDSERAAQARAAKTATHQALDQTIAMQKEVEHAQQNARAQAAVAAASAGRARTELERLREQLAAAHRLSDAMPTDSCSADRQAASTARQLLGTCAQEYADLARDADQIDIELGTVLAAWPRNPPDDHGR